MKRLAEIKGEITTWRQLEEELKELKELASLEWEDADEALKEEIEADVEELATKLDEIELELAFDSKYDNRNAILAIHAGAGGVESQDWAEILLRMYLRWAERRGFKTELLDTSPGEEAGIKSTTLEISGPHASGYLKSEHGVHRLVRLSPFDADHARHTSFVLVEVMPEVEKDIEIKLDPTDLKIEVFRSSGPGGQHMQKTSSAVRITHLPSGIVSKCQNERSQYRNKEVALKILKSRLLRMELSKREDEEVKLKGERIVAGWGNQIRSYVLHPYRMVKDHRTDFETGNTEAVLDGDIDGFIRAYLRTQIGSNSA
jgi:peptide chain release factor 2